MCKDTIEGTAESIEVSVPFDIKIITDAIQALSDRVDEVVDVSLGRVQKIKNISNNWVVDSEEEYVKTDETRKSFKLIINNCDEILQALSLDKEVKKE